MKTCIVVPVKDFRSAKQRLAGVLSRGGREQLARWLCQRTLRFFAEHFAEYPLLVVTGSGDVARLAGQHGAEVIREETAAGLSAAVHIAATRVGELGFASMLVIPADIARLDEDEIRTLLNCPRDEASVILCPARDAGTNALLCTPPDVIPFHFGEASSVAHREATERVGARFRLLVLHHLGVDLDRSDDLRALTLPTSILAPTLRSRP